MTSESGPAPQRYDIFSRLQSLSLEYKLPLMMAPLLTVLLAGSFLVAYVTHARATEQRVAARLGSAAHQVAGTAQAALQERYRRQSRLGASAVVRNALARSSAALAADDERVLRQALAPLALADDLPVELLARDGTVLLRLGPHLAQRPPLPIEGDSVRAGPMFAAAGRAHAWTVTRVSARGETLGFIATVLRVGGPANATQQLSDFTGERVSIHMRNGDGSLWVRSPDRIAVSPSARHETARGLYFERAETGRTVAAEAPIAGGLWYVVLETPLALVRARSRGIISLLAGTSLVLLVAGMVVASWLSRRITRPLREASDAAEAITRGDHSARVHAYGDDEIGRLAASFNQMAEQLELSRRELLRRVREAQTARSEAERLRTIAEHAREDAERASRAKSDFLAVMSHELRTPLNAIGGYAQLLELGVHGPVTPQQRDALERIARNQKHLLTLINDVLNYAKLDAGKVQYAISDVAVADLVRELEMLIGSQLTTAQLTLAQAPVDASLCVRADRDKLQQILLNLLTNAVKFTPSAGTITIEAEAVEEQVAITVRDSGIGIPPDRLEAIFEPFFQAERALNRPGEGVGLGLTISRDLAHGMGGELRVHSVPGAGSSFTVLLPRGASILQPV